MSSLTCSVLKKELSLTKRIEMEKNYYALWSHKGKTQKGTNVFLDLKKSGNLKVTLSKSLGNGEYEREELSIPEPIIEKLRDTLNSNFPPATSMPAKQTAKAYSISDIRKKQGQKAYAPWTDADDRELMELYKQGYSVDKLSEHFKRGKNAIRSRLNKHGIN